MHVHFGANLSWVKLVLVSQDLSEHLDIVYKQVLVQVYWTIEMYYDRYYGKRSGGLYHILACSIYFS